MNEKQKQNIKFDLFQTQTHIQIFIGTILHLSLLSFILLL